MIQLRLREWEWDEWTFVTVDGDIEFIVQSFLGAAADSADFEIEKFDEDQEEWRTL